MEILIIVVSLLCIIGFKEKSKLRKPLDKELEKKYIKAYKEKKSEEARNMLIESNMRLVANIAKKYVGTKYEFEDLISIGTIGLIKAVETYIDKPSNKLATYASRCIENEILMYLRKNKKRLEDVSMYDSVGKDKEGNDLLVIDTIDANGKSIENLVEDDVFIDVILKNLNEILSKEEKKIIESRYGINRTKKKTQKEIAIELNISRSYVSRIEKQALEKIKDHLMKKNEK